MRSSLQLLNASYVLLAVWTAPWTASDARRTVGGARAPGGSRGSGASGAKSASAYGASARGASVLASPPNSGGAATGFSSAGGFAGASLASSRTASGFSHSISKARDKISHSMKSIVRPKAKITRPTIHRPVKPLFNPSYSTIYGNKKGLSTGKLVMAGVGGYFLGRILGRMAGPQQYPPYYNDYVPYRSRFATQAPVAPVVIASSSIPSPAAAASANKNVDVCLLHRWNQELPFTETPNMAIDFLANDTVSGTDLHTKAGFMFSFLERTMNTFGLLNNSVSIFEIPSGYNMRQCNFQTSEEPLITSMQHLKNLYSSVSSDPRHLDDLVEAAQSCIPQFGDPLKSQVFPCLDYAIDANQVLNLSKPDSIFNNDELCRDLLSPKLLQCALNNEDECTVHHLLTINMFARDFYLCSEPVHRDTMVRLQDDAFLRDFQNANAASLLSLPGFRWLSFICICSCHSLIQTFISRLRL